jgi:hypothetical protein
MWEWGDRPQFKLEENRWDQTRYEVPAGCEVLTNVLGAQVDIVTVPRCDWAPEALYFIRSAHALAH